MFTPVTGKDHEDLSSRQQRQRKVTIKQTSEEFHEDYLKKLVSRHSLSTWKQQVVTLCIYHILTKKHFHLMIQKLYALVTGMSQKIYFMCS